LYEFEQYLHDEVDLPVLIRLALIHYQFETIHPFGDGNGRIGRLLIALQMVEQGLLPGPMLYLSAFFERHRREYMDRLLGVSQRAEWLPWIEFFLTGVAQQARHAVLTANSLLNLRDSYRLRLQKARGSALPLTLVDSLFDRPAIMVASAQRLLRVTPRSAQLNIEKLMAHGILTEVTGQQRNRVYVAREIIQTANS
jgi:Fic family protein